MRRTISLAEVIEAGVTLTPEEAIAIAQQLIRPPIAVSRAGIVQVAGPAHAIEATRPPFGPPTADNVFLASDGTVSCVACDVTLAVSELARLLQDALPLETMRIPGSLRYTIARALLDVDAPPFDSLEEFSEALARYERGNRADHVRHVLDRTRQVMARGAADAAPIVDRRRITPEIFELRRQLREADARLYDQQLALDALAVVAGPPARRSRHGAVAAGLAIGLTLVGAGELMHSYHAVDQARREAVLNVPERAGAVSDSAKPLVGLTAEAETSGPTNESAARGEARRGLTRDHVVTPAADRARDDISRASVPTSSAAARPPRVAKISREEPRARRAPPGILDRLHLRWLRGKIVIRRDDL